MTIQDNQLAPFLAALPEFDMMDNKSREFQIEKFGFFLSFTAIKTIETEESIGNQYTGPTGHVISSESDIVNLYIDFDGEEIQLTKDQENTLYTDLIQSIL